MADTHVGYSLTPELKYGAEEYLGKFYQRFREADRPLTVRDFPEFTDALEKLRQLFMRAERFGILASQQISAAIYGTKKNTPAGETENENYRSAQLNLDIQR